MKLIKSKNLFFYLAIFFTSLTVLLLEIFLTRIYSLIFYYHLSFMAVTLALLGLGIGGIILFIIRQKNLDLMNYLKVISLLFPFSILLLLILFALGGNVAYFGSSYFIIIVYLLACIVPFSLAGFIISYLLIEKNYLVSKLYFFDLLGAAVGAFLVIVLLNLFGGDSGLIGIAIISFFVPLALSRICNYPTKSIILIFSLLIVFLFVNYFYSILTISQQNTQIMAGVFQKYIGIKPIFNKWNAFSSVGVYQISYSPEVLAIRIDAGAETDLVSSDYYSAHQEENKSRIENVVYYLKEGAESLIIGPGGGRDVAAALMFNAQKVVGVEINPIIVNDIMLDKFNEFSGNLYNHPKVEIIVDEARSYVRRSDKKYDIIQATLVDTWAATSAGAFTLTENNLYTKEAFDEYMSHLKDDGIISFTRWYVPEEPSEMLRLVSLGLSALEDEGKKELGQHFIILSKKKDFHEPQMATILIKKSKFTLSELKTINQLIDNYDYEILYLPHNLRENVFSQYINSQDQGQFIKNYSFNIKAPTDDNPFFFYTLKIKDFSKTKFMDFNNLSLMILFVLLGVVSFMVLFFLIFPFFFLKSGIKTDWLIIYFILIGLGYIMIEIILMQKFILFLGHPIYSLTVVLTSLLIASSLGSATTHRWELYIKKKIVLIVLLLLFIILLYLLYFLPFLFQKLLISPLFIRAITTSLLVALPGFFMGMFFPLGIKLISHSGKSHIPWAWAVNSVCSVLGSILAIILAINFGYNLALIFALFCYLLIIPVVFLRKSVV